MKLLRRKNAAVRRERPDSSSVRCNITNTQDVYDVYQLYSIDDDVDMRLSEDETPIQPEDAHTPSSNHRPPSYNPEDYANALAKYSRAPNLYIHDQKDKKARGKDKEKSSQKDLQCEMSLKQFASLPELLRRLREDLKAAYIGFVKELVRDPHDGVALLIDLLKMIQLAQSNLSGSATNREQQIALRRTLIDEFECLSCLRCCLRCSEAAPRLANHRNGLYPLAAATMSSLTRSRTIALQLLTKACENSVCGHRQVIEAFSTLRLRFAEPVRCKFLVSMMLSYPHPSFQVWGLKFINALLSSSVSIKERVYLQEELGEAGFDAGAIRKALEHRGAATPEQQEAVRSELDKWNESYIDLSGLEDQLGALKSANISLQQELQQLRQSNMKLLEENVLVKAVGGEVEERCCALKRRLEKYGIPSAPSPTPSVTDSEVSSFINTGRSTVRRNNAESPSRTMDRFPGGTMSTIYGVEGERSTSLEWRKIRPDPEGKGRDSHGILPPVPKKRNILVSPDLATRKSVYVNDLCNGTFHDAERPLHQDNNSSRIPTSDPYSQVKNKQNESAIDRCHKEGLSDTSSCIPPKGSSSLEKDGKETSNIRGEEEHIYQFPVKPSRPKSRKRNLGSKSSQEDIASNEGIENMNKSKENSEKSLSSSASSLSMTPSTISIEGAEQKAHEEPEYENIHKKADENGQSKVSASSGLSNKNFVDDNNQSIETDAKNSNGRSESQNSSTNCNNDSASKNKTRQGTDDGEIEYERNVVVYEAITLGNDTILLEKNNTNSSSGSNDSKKSENSNGNKNSIPEISNVQNSVRHYENLATRDAKKESKDWKNNRTGEKSENKSIFNGILNGLKNGKKRGSKLEKKESKKKSSSKGESKDNKSNSCSPAEKEIEAVMKDFENAINKAESSASLASLGENKENTLTSNHFEDRASPEHPMHEIEIVPTRVPQIPPRSRFKGTYSHSSRSRTPDTVVYLESPSETSDTNDFPGDGIDSTDCTDMDTTSKRSFGWSRGNAGIKRRDTFAVCSPDKNNHKQYRLRRSESVHVNNRLEYNSHRSYSPRRRGSTELLVPLEESEVQISGRRFTQYTAAEVAEVERRNQVNNMISSGMKRRRNRSCDDRLDRWLDEDCLRHSRYGYSFAEDYPPHFLESSQEMLNDERIRNSYFRSSVPTSDLSRKPSRSSKCRGNPSAVSNGSVAGLRGNDFSSNFILNSSPNPHHFEEALIDIAEMRGPGQGGKCCVGRLPRKILAGDPAIPTPDYSATPASTLTNNNGPPTGRHILEMASGLY